MKIGRPMVDLTGQRFGRLLVIGMVAERNARGQAFWRSVCDCGGAAVTRSDTLRAGRAQSCGCAAKERAANQARAMGAAHKKDLTGARFGRLLIVREAAREAGKRVQWVGLCDCGAEHVADAGNLRAGKTQSCGCGERDSRIKHGLAHTPGYKAAGCAKRRTRKSRAGGSYTEAQMRRLYASQKGACRYCNCSLDYRDIHRDHRMPVALGGSSDITNMQILCRTCNLSKGSLHPDDFESKIGYVNHRWKKD